MYKIINITIIILLAFSCLAEKKDISNIRNICFTFEQLDKNTNDIESNVFTVNIQKNKYNEILSVIDTANKFNKLDIRKRELMSYTSIKAKIIIYYHDRKLNDEYIYLNYDLIYDVNRKIYLRSKNLTKFFMESVLIIFSRLSDN